MNQQGDGVMVAGFENADDFASIVGWELYQVTLDKHHVMFLFENGWQLLNVAAAFSHRSADATVDYTYSLRGGEQRLDVGRLLRERVEGVTVTARDCLTLTFSNGDLLVIHDDPETCSWWFVPIDNPSDPDHRHSWSLSDTEAR